jgi:hypothetical protein
MLRIKSTIHLDEVVKLLKESQQMIGVDISTEVNKILVFLLKKKKLITKY